MYTIENDVQATDAFKQRTCNKNWNTKSSCLMLLFKRMFTQSDSRND